MQILVDIASNKVLSTRSTPVTGQNTTINGKYIVEVPSGVGVEVLEGAYLLPQDAGSLPIQIAQEFLARNPMYNHYRHNFFLEASDSDQLHLSPGAPVPTAANVVSGFLPTMQMGFNGPRCQTGRGAGPLPVGIAPNSVRIQAANTSRITSTYGCVVTKTLDITALNPMNPGTDEVLVWWKLATLASTEDVVQGYNFTAGQNTPALRVVQEVQQEPPNFFVYASVDDGVTWREVKYLRPTDLVVPGVLLRLAFVNESNTPYNLLGFVILFPNLP